MTLFYGQFWNTKYNFFQSLVAYHANSPVSFQTNPDLKWSSKQQSSKDFEVRDALKKNAALIWVFSKPGPTPATRILELLGHFALGFFCC